MGKLQDKVTIITGGISGIGKASADLFAAEGAKLILVDMDEEKGQEVASEYTSNGHEAIFIRADVTSEADAENVFNKTIKKFGRVDILFNNAGIGAVKPTHEVPYAEYRKTVNVDLDAVFLFAQHAIKRFLEQGGGIIVNTASMYGWIGAPGLCSIQCSQRRRHQPHTLPRCRICSEEHPGQRTVPGLHRHADHSGRPEENTFRDHTNGPSRPVRGNGQSGTVPRFR